MAGVTNAAFRQLCRSYGGALVRERDGHRARSGRTQPQDRAHGRSVRRRRTDSLACSSTASIPRVMERRGAQARRRRRRRPRRHELRLPGPKVTKLGGGAALPMHHNLFAAIVRAAVRAAGDVPVTVKMRVGVSDEHVTFLRAARTAVDAGVRRRRAARAHRRAALLRHARTGSRIAELVDRSGRHRRARAR